MGQYGWIVRWVIAISLLLTIALSHTDLYQLREDIMRLIHDDALAIATIWQEARGEPYEGKLAVAAVIRNRMKKKYTSDGTVEGTVLADYQFSGWNTDPHDSSREQSVRIDDQDPVVRDCMQAWKESELIDPTHGAVLYFAPKGVKQTPKWAEPKKAKLVSVINNHQFYIPL
jgi:N-acetylmuramoyl-L-alanine amidase